MEVSIRGVYNCHRKFQIGKSVDMYICVLNRGPVEIN